MSIMANLLDKMFNLRGNHRKSPSKSQQLPKPKISHWQPSYLRRPVLIIFVVAFCGIIAALETLNHLSQAHNGIASSVESRHYLWTYGPTAIITVVAAFWSRVEFQVKERAPWKSMAGKPEDAKLNILLDYISAANGTLDDSPPLGNITMSNRLRLLQDAASTRVLEALLASMLVLGILGSILMNTDRVLPKNPSSIAAVASLLADSNALVHYERVMGDPNEPSLGQAFFPRCRFFLGFKEDGPSQGDPRQLSNAEYDKKYCIYFSEWDSEKISSDHFGMTGESGHKRTTRVEERFI